MHLRTKQFASAFHHLSASVNLNATFAPSFMLLGVALMHLNDYDNSIAALDKAAEMEPCALCVLFLLLRSAGAIRSSRSMLPLCTSTTATTSRPRSSLSVRAAACMCDCCRYSEFEARLRNSPMHAVCRACVALMR